MRRLIVLGVAAGVAGCESGVSPLDLPTPVRLEPIDTRPVPKTPRLPPPDDEDELFDPGRVVEIDLFMEAQDVERMRVQSRGEGLFLGEDCQDGPFPDPFTFFRGTAVIDREVVENVSIKKRGFFPYDDPRVQAGDRLRPSLEVRFDMYEADRTFAGRRRLFLDAAIQDRTAMRTCLAYRLFRRAGLPAPRCNFALVRVNGASLGIYANVEPIDRAFVDATFTPGGGLWEGKASDFRDGWMATFEGEGGDSSTLTTMRDALLVPDDELQVALAPLIDLEAFHRFWAMETVLGHFDGYTGNADRFYVYDDPAAGLVFMPNGTGIAFRNWAQALRAAFPQPASVMGQGEIARRLYLTAEGRTRHLLEVQAVLDQVWDETWIRDEIDRMSELIERRASWRAEGFAEEVELLRAFVDGRRAEIQAELAAGGIDWDVQQRPFICLAPWGFAEAEFQTYWGSAAEPNPFVVGSATVSAVFLDLTLEQTEPGFALAGEAEEGLVSIIAAVANGPATLHGVQVILPLADVRPGTVEIDLQTTFAQLIWTPEPNAEVEWLATLAGATLELTAAGTEPGDPIVGRVSGPLY